MPRPEKNNADYFSHDAGMRNDPKIKALRRKYREGYGIYCMMLEVLTHSAYFEFEVNPLQVELLAGDFDIESALLQEIINYCVTIELFSKAEQAPGVSATETKFIIYSNGLKKRLQPVIEKRLSSKSKFLQQKDAKEVVSVTETTQAPGVSATETTQKKRNKRKRKESKLLNTVIGDGEPSPPTQPGPKKTVEEKQAECKIRQKSFYDSLVPFTSTYGKEMLRAFYNYWSEPNKTKTKFKQEGETTWDTARRLERWQKNEAKFNKGAKDKAVQETTGGVIDELKALREHQTN